MQDLTVTIVQSDLAWENPDANLAVFERTIAGLQQATDVIVLPEMFTTGFSMAAEKLAEAWDGPTTAWMRRMADAADAAVCGSVIIAEGGRFYNRFVWMPPGGPAVGYDKRHLFRMAGEHRHFTPGSERALLSWRGWRICPLICYDLRFPVFSRHVNTCDLMLFVANWPSPRQRAWCTLLAARAIENICYVAGVNRTGVDGAGIDYPGRSGVIDYTGEWLCDAGSEPAVHSVRLDAKRLETFRERFPFHLDADAFDGHFGPQRSIR